MRIVAYRDFQHSGSLKGFFDTKDPRESRFAESDVEVDLRQCEFVRPAGVLWFVIYLLLAKEKGADCTLLVPQGMEVCIYLKSLGVFDVLKDAGVEVGDKDIPLRPAPQLVIPLTRLFPGTLGCAPLPC